ncbi:MAG TPA: TIGR03067 domain-containing protein [Rhizomicrobium sp.]|nr:TIGR03067 domain-containing protein [Rhizomicrobium sp.]
MSRLSRQDLQALQGVWEQVALEVDGILDPPDDLSPAGVLTTFRNDHFAIRTAEGALLLEGNFILDALANPKAITWTDAMGPDAGKQLPAIYRLDGDAFVFIAADADAPRPTAFRTGPGQTMRSFVRRR